MRIVDTKGLNCPVPIIETRKALKSARAGEAFLVLTDNKTAFSNISKYLDDNKIKFNVSEENGTWTFKITKKTGEKIKTMAKEYCETTKPETIKGNYSVVISSEYMGHGDNKLGRKLIKSFFDVLCCLDSMPSAIMFYNSGVKLAVIDSPVIEMLRDIEGKGVEILICGTCVNHFKLGDRIKIGRITDMYMITQKLSETGKIIRP